MIRFALLAALLASGCAYGEAIERELPPFNLPPEPAPIAVTTDPTAAQACAAAALRWFDATGIELDCSTILINVTNDIVDNAAAETWPGLEINMQTQYVTLLEAAELILLHELGHWIAGWPSVEHIAHPPNGGAMCWWVDNYDQSRITQADVDWLCSIATCAWERPEQQSVAFVCPLEFP